MQSQLTPLGLRRSVMRSRTTVTENVTPQDKMTTLPPNAKQQTLQEYWRRLTERLGLLNENLFTGGKD